MNRKTVHLVDVVLGFIIVAMLIYITMGNL
jgi:hypothetical protein